jgi:apolipoprotein N-acyltransferase
VASPTDKIRLLTPSRLGLLALGGLLGVLAFPLAFPFGPRRELLPSGVLEPLAFICLVPVLAATRGLSPRRAFGGGFLAGWVFFTGAFWWVNVAMTTFGGMPHAASIPALLALAAWCAFHWGLALGLTRFLEARHGWAAGLVFGPVWMATELLRNYLFSGFPWANLGYSQMRNLWLSQVGSLVGVYGVALLVAFVNGALYEALRAVRWKERVFPRALVGAAVAALVLGHVYGFFRVRAVEAAMAQAPTVRVAVVQGNIDQKLKNAQGTHASMVLAAYNPPTSAADDARADLIVWPEASYPIAFIKGTKAIQGRGLERMSYKARLLLGVDVVDPNDLRHGSENAAYLVSPDLRVEDQYTKYHLVPFGEYVLFNLDKYLPIDNLVPGTFKAGTEIRPFKLTVDKGGTSHEVRIGTEICFDAIFPEISRTYARQDVNVLVNLTNDAWYGFSAAPFQFLRMVAMRAVETGRPVARAANTGISAFIDPLGRIHQPTPIGLVQSDNNQVDAGLRVPPEWRVQDLPLMSGTTPYVVIGDVPAYLAAAFTVGAWAWGLSKGRRARKQQARA